MTENSPAKAKYPLKRSFEKHLRYYKAHHRTTGCKVTHMIGIPMIVLSFLVFPFSRKTAGQLQVGGWILQFIGHYVFEHNSPVILEMRDPLTLGAALVFVTQEWRRFLSKEAL